MRMRSCCALMMTMTMTTVMLTTTTMCRVRALVADFASTSNEHLFFLSPRGSLHLSSGRFVVECGCYDGAFFCFFCHCSVLKGPVRSPAAEASLRRRPCGGRHRVGCQRSHSVVASQEHHRQCRRPEARRRWCGRELARERATWWWRRGRSSPSSSSSCFPPAS